jgi:orotidine-5'-phosphate decarboxylase
MDDNNKVIVALDYSDTNSALEFIEKANPNICRLKIGSELFSSKNSGFDFVEKVANKGFDVFLDLKWYDIPNTVAKACNTAADSGAWMMNLHASGGQKMMETAMNKLEQRTSRPLLIAVTILTSLDTPNLYKIGYSGSPFENVIRLAKLTKKSGLDGNVCSPLEVTGIRNNIQDKTFKLVTPGVRPKGSAVNDQKRIMTPIEAIDSGSDFLVIGRPITEAEDPIKALIDINNSIYS